MSAAKIGVITLFLLMAIGRYRRCHAGGYTFILRAG